MDIYLSGKFYDNTLTVWKYFKMLKRSSNFCFLCSERLIFYGVLPVNWHDQNSLGQQNGKEITLKITVK